VERQLVLRRELLSQLHKNGGGAERFAAVLETESVDFSSRSAVRKRPERRADSASTASS
jgi:hypothetical protein